jgi:hypothetical protein
MSTGVAVPRWRADPGTGEYVALADRSWPVDMCSMRHS